MGFFLNVEMSLIKIRANGIQCMLVAYGYNGDIVDLKVEVITEWL